MNSVIGLLVGFCREHLLDEKIFVVPSYQVGHQIGESLGKNGLYFTSIDQWIEVKLSSCKSIA
jgi:ATP-dependent helicase/nuclease subunit B